MDYTINLASDHGGFEFKEFLLYALEELGYEVVDHGTYDFDPLDDYPDFISLAVREVSSNPETNKAVVFGGSGQGEAMLANRFSNVRAAVYYSFDPNIIKVSREHNDANVLSVGARFMTKEEMLESVLYWLDAPFSQNPKYERRIEKMEQAIVPGEDLL